MLKEILVLLLIVGGVFFGFQLYNNNWDLGAAIASTTSLISPDGATSTDSIIGAISGIAGTGTIAKLAYDSLKSKATQQVTDLSNVVVDKNTELESYKLASEQKITDLEAQVEALKTEVPDLTDLENEVFTLKEDVKNKQQEVDAITTMHENFVNKLASASNNETVIDPATNTVYKVIKITETKVV